MPKAVEGAGVKYGVTDIDGVLASSGEAVVKEVNLRWGLKLDAGKINRWTWVSETVAELTGSEEEGRRAEELWFDPEVLAMAKPVPGACEALSELTAMGWVIWAATSRRPNARLVTKEWINAYFPMIRGLYMLEDGNDERISSVEVKLAAVGMLGAKLYVDDDPRAIDHVVKSYKNTLMAALVTRGWNRQQPGFDQFRVEGWEHVVARVRGDK